MGKKRVNFIGKIKQDDRIELKKLLISQLNQDTGNGS